MPESVAIIGVGGIFPRALNARAFWKNVLNKVDGISEVPQDRWDSAVFYDPKPLAPDKTYSKVGGFVTEFKFDPLRFRIPPSVSKSIDPVQQRVLVAAQEALEDAGYAKKLFDRPRTAVILGASGALEKTQETNKRIWYDELVNALRAASDFHSLPSRTQQVILDSFEKGYKSNLSPITEDSMPGESVNIIAGRVANVFDFGGKNMTVDAACASSHAAFDVAVKGLASSEFDLVLTGGASASMDPTWYVKFCKIGALSLSSRSRPFDEKADGFVMGEGVCVLILKRLVDAMRDGDKIYAVVRGIGSSSDGKGKGITAPNPAQQALAIKRALESAHLTPRHIQLIEAHATSTAIGDVAEMQAYANVYQAEYLPPKSIAVGSVKSQIGHLQAAAGAAGLLKAALALYHKILPPSINFETPNSRIPWEKTPFYVNTETEPWPDPPNGEPRRVGVSAFGFGGINYHVVLEEYVPEYHCRLLEEPAEYSAAESVEVKSQPRSATPSGRATEDEVVLISADSLEGLSAGVKDLHDKMVTARSFQQFAYHSRLQSKGKRIRLAICARSLEDMEGKLRGIDELLRASKNKPLELTRGVFFGEGVPQGKLGLIFPGQGSQYANMLRELANKYSIVRRTFDEADEVTEKLLGRKITTIVFPKSNDPSAIARSEEYLRRTEYTHPAMLAADVALFRLLVDWGLRPDVVAGHSLGEYAALVAGGVLSFREALMAVSGRGREMANLRFPDPGKMAVVFADEATIATNLEGIEGYVIVANKNSPRQTVIAGETSAVLAAIERFNSRGIPAQLLNVSAAFHTEIVAPAREPFRKVIERLEVVAPQMRIYSNVNAEPYSVNAEEIVNLLVQQIASPVHWQKTLENMYRDGVRIFLEVGPKRALTTSVGDTLGNKGDVLFFFTNHPNKGDISSINETAARLLALGFDLQIKQEPPSPSQPALHTPTEPRSFAVAADATSSIKPDVKPSISAAPRTQTQIENVQKRVMTVVSEKVGYPPEMLQPDLDMEADLGIDTVKQGEIFSILREQFHIGRDSEFKLKDYPTLNHVVDYITKRLWIDIRPTIPEPASPTIPKTDPVSQIDDVLNEIQAIAASKTGYATELLDPTLDLEADLGIDAVKQAEIFALVREKFVIPRLEKFKLKDYPTLGKIALFVRKNRSQVNRSLALETGRASLALLGTGMSSEVEQSTRRLAPRLVTWPLPIRSNPALLQGCRFLVTLDAGGVAALVISNLKSNGARVLEVDPERILREMEKVVQECRAEGPLNGILHLAPLDLIGGPYDFDGKESQRLSCLYGKSLFLLARAFAPELEDGLVLTTTAMGGRHGIETQKLEKVIWSPLAGVVTGLAKALAQEFPDLRVRALDMEPLEARDSRATIILEELLALISHEESPVEIGRFGSQRVAVRTLPAEKLGEPSKFPISEGLPILVSGGGSGITAEVLKGLLISKPLLKAVEASKVHLVILGRTSLPENIEELAGLSDERLAVLKESTAMDLNRRGERATPAVIDRAFAPTLKAVVIQRNIKALRALGADVVYVRCDVGDERALKSAVENIKARYGLIGGVLHAAGIDESKHLTDKAPEAWDHVLHGKVLGAVNLARITRDQPLRFFIMFGSIAGRFGNAGQADYCAASDVLAKLAHGLRALGIPASTYEWSAWRDVGMATKGGTLKFLEDAGIEPLSTEDGVNLFLAELSGGQDAEIVLTKTLGSMEELKSRIRIFANDECSVGALAGYATKLLPGASVVTHRILDVARDAFLEDHRVDHVPYLPGVLGLEAFAEAGKCLLNYASLTELSNVALNYPVKMLRDMPVNYETRSEIYQAAPEGAVEVRSQLETRTPLSGELEKVNFSATLRFGAPPEEQNAVHGVEIGEPLVPWSTEHLYPPILLGPSFQVLERVEAIGPRGLNARARVPKAPHLSKFSLTRAPVLEAAGHAAAFWGLMIHNTRVLFHAVARVKYSHAEPASSDEFELRVKHATFDGQILRCDVDALDIRGIPILQIIGLEQIAIGTEEHSNGDLSKAAPFPLNFDKIAEHEVYRVPIQWVALALRDPTIFDELLSSEERKAFSALAKTPLKRQAEWMAATLAAKAALRAAVHEAKPWKSLTIRRDTKRGIPPTVEGLPIQVSISHAGEWAAAVSYDSERERVGLDVELVENRAPSFLDEAFSANEQAALQGPEDSTRAWCIKEAVLKALRLGLRADLYQISVDLAITPPRVKLSRELRTGLETANVLIHEASWDNRHRVVIATIRR